MIQRFITRKKKRIIIEETKNNLYLNLVAGFIVSSQIAKIENNLLMLLNLNYINHIEHYIYKKHNSIKCF